MTENMRVIEVAEGGARLVVAERPMPIPAAGEVLVRVRATGINRADLSQRAGRYHLPPGAPDILGLEIAGEVVAHGPGISHPPLGARVCALLIGGGYAEYCAVPAVQTAPIPQGLTDVEGAAIIETACTVWDNVFTRAALAPGERLLVHGGSSGIGVMAIQIAVALHHPIMVTVGSAEKRDRCLELGADAAVLYKEEDFVQAARDFGGDGVDVILDMVGGPYLGRNLSALAPEGRLAIISVSGGAAAEADLRVMMSRRLTVMASTLRARAPAAKGAVVDAVREHLWPHLAQGRIRPIIDSVWAFTDVDAAHDRMAKSEHVGKLVIRMDL